MVSVKRNIVRYNKYVSVITVVVVFVSYFHNYCDFLRRFSSRYLFVQAVVLYALLFFEQRSIVLSLFHYKYRSEYLLCGRLQLERT